eukprot:Selendium_serpulae@DN2941_c0_g1_i1.p1
MPPKASAPADVRSPHLEYLARSVNPLVEPLVVRMVEERPANPAQFMANWLASEMNVVDDSDDDDEDDDDEVADLPTPVPKVLARPRHSVSAEAYGEWNKKREFTPPEIPKTDDQMKRIRQVLQESFLFTCLEEKDLKVVIGAMEEKILSEKTRIIQQGDDGDHLYVIEKGEFKCFKKFPDEDEEVMVKTCVVGDAFGELALLYNCPRAASVESVDEATLWALDRETFNHIVKDAAAKKRALHESFLAQVKVLAGLDPYQRSKIADCVKQESFHDNDVVVKQGDAGDKFYFIEKGEAVAEINGIQVMKYDEGDYFGELALLKNEPRAASVIAKGEELVVISLERKAFKRLLGPLEDILKSNTSRYHLPQEIAQENSEPTETPGPTETTS